jgi:hypothetical protein
MHWSAERRNFRTQNTSLDGEREGGRASLPSLFQERPSLQEKGIQAGPKNKDQRHDPKCAPEAIKIVQTDKEEKNKT